MLTQEVLIKLKQIHVDILQLIDPKDKSHQAKLLRKIQKLFNILIINVRFYLVKKG